MCQEGGVYCELTGLNRVYIRTKRAVPTVLIYELTGLNKVYCCTKT